MKIDYVFDNLGDVGIVKDTPPENLPENAWSDGQNVRFREGSVQKFTGHDQVFGTTTASSGPIHALELAKGASLFWVYADENNLLITDGTTHENASSGTYAATLDVNWSGGVMAGGIAVLNNGFDAPQQWTGSALTDNFTDLSNWPAGMVARILHVHNQFLVAADIDEGSGRDGTLLRWSHPAAPGAVPASWDYTDATKDAGRTSLPEGGDYIIDMRKLRDSTVVYKNEMCYAMSFIGGRATFSFRKLFDQVGMFTRRCAKEFYGNHFVVCNSDVVVHDGQTVNSILNRKWQTYLFNAIDSTNYQRTFVAANYRKNEMWICYPEAGYTLPNVALVWNWKDNTIGVRDLPPGCAHIAWGIVDPAVGTTFADLNGTYASQNFAFDDQSYSGAKQAMLMCSYDDNAFYRADQTNQFNGANMDVYVARQHLPLGNVTQRGKLIYEPSRIKTVLELWPIIHADAGTEITVTISTRFNESDSASSETRIFTVGTDEVLYYRKTGRIIDIEYRSDSNVDWELIRYRIVFDLAEGHR